MLKTGIDRLIETKEYDSLLRNKRIGLITTPTGLTKDYVSTIDALHRKYHLSALFSPEHGVRGDKKAGEYVESYMDPKTGVMVYSLYRKDGKRLTKEMLDAIDVIVYDIQDVGTRYYTFIYTMMYALEDCKNAGKEFVVCDRPNPLGCEIVEGNCLREAYRSFVGGYPLCNRYGLTIGEFARMVNECSQLHGKLTIVPCEGYRRKMMYPDFEKPWIIPSLGLPRFESALLYPGTCLFEGTNVSEGRGTTAPFEIIGAPFINGSQLASKMNEKKLQGVQFLPMYFSPTISKHQGTPCEGVMILITNRYEVRSVALGIHLLRTICKLYPNDFEFLPPYKSGKRRMIELLSGDSLLLQEKITAKEIIEQYEQEANEFKKRVEKYRIYDE